MVEYIIASTAKFHVYHSCQNKYERHLSWYHFHQPWFLLRILKTVLFHIMSNLITCEPYWATAPTELLFWRNEVTAVLKLYLSFFGGAISNANVRMSGLHLYGVFLVLATTPMCFMSISHWHLFSVANYIMATQISTQLMFHALVRMRVCVRVAFVFVSSRLGLFILTVAFLVITEGNRDLGWITNYED